MDSCETDGWDAGFNADQKYNVIHIHPTRRCNLACRHCYSTSGPGIRHELAVGPLNPFLEYTFENGFNIVSISGGEPFLYGQLKDLLKAAKRIGYLTQVATNGMLLKSAKNQECLEYLDLIAVSLDGFADQHDQIRCLNGAFEKTVQGIEFLKSIGKDFGIIHTVTNQSWPILIRLADFAFDKGAKLFQLHPLEYYGRAQNEFSTDRLTQESLHRSFILARYLKAKYYGRMHVQFDVFHRDYLMDFPQAVSLYGKDFTITKHNFPDFVKTIVVDEWGSVVPFSYGFSSEFEICNVRDYNRARDPFQHFVETKGAALYELIENCFREIEGDEHHDIVAWTEFVVARSLAASSKLVECLN